MADYPNLDDPILVKVEAPAQSIQLANDNKDLGFNEILLEEVNTVVKFGRDALQSKVPLKTGQLRNDQIKIIGDIAGYRGQVEISPGVLHTNSNGANPPLATQLAEMLDKGAYKRSGPSEATGGFSGANGLTTNWIEEALSEFDDKVQGS